MYLGVVESYVRLFRSSSVTSDLHLLEEVMKSTFKVLALAAAVAVAPFTAAPALADGEKYILVSHAPDSDSWLSLIHI